MVDSIDNKILELVKNPSTRDKGFKLLMDTYQKKLYWSIKRNVGNHDDTDDILQNTLIKAYKGIHNFEERSSLFTWLYRIALNETYTFNKNNIKKATTSYDTSTENIKEGMSFDFDFNDAIAKLQKAIASLPEKQRQVFNMRYYDELTYQEMSSMLATSEGALKASYHIALKKIESIILS